MRAAGVDGGGSRPAVVLLASYLDCGGCDPQKGQHVPIYIRAVRNEFFPRGGKI